MAIHSHKKQKKHSQKTANANQANVNTQLKTSAVNLKDNRPESILQRKLQEKLNRTPKSSSSSNVIQKQCDNPNCTNKSCTGNDCNAPKPMAPYDPKQKHLAKHALVVKGKPTMVIAEDFDGKHGVKSMNNNNKLDKKSIENPKYSITRVLEVLVLTK